MSAKDTVSQLPSPLRDLVLTAGAGEAHYGASDKDKTEVSDWLAKVVKGDIAKPQAAQVR